MIKLQGISKVFTKKNQQKVNRYFFATLLRSFYSRKQNSSNISVLENINLEIAQGERVAFIGKNRSGKTTLMHIIANISRPTGGSLHVKGKVAPIFGLGVGFSILLTGRENLILNATSLGASIKWVNEHIAAIQAFSEIENLDVPLKFYSNGMKARLALSVAMFIEADVLILDEVFDGVDIFFREKAIARLQLNIQEKGTTLIVVSHDEDILRQLCTSAIYMRQGEIVEKGDISLLDKYKLDLH